MVNRHTLRNALVDHIKAVSNEVMTNLGNLTPRQAVLRDYVDGEIPLHDPEWYELLCAQTPAPLIPSLPQSQYIANFEVGTRESFEIYFTRFYSYFRQIIRWKRIVASPGFLLLFSQAAFAEHELVFLCHCIVNHCAVS
jgi:hypothetical protein